VEKRERNPVSKTLRALSWLAESSLTQVGVRQLATAMNVAPSTAHRILLTLSEAGFIRQDEKTQRYALGNEFFRLSQLAVAKSPLRQASLAAMQTLVETCHESALLCVYDEHRQEVNFAAVVNSADHAENAIELNKWLPVRTGASGLAILAFLKEAEVQSITRRTNFLQRADVTLTEPDRLRSKLAAVRHEGYAFTRCQFVAGAVGLAAPIFGCTGKVVGDICLTIPRERAEATSMDRLIDATRRCANDVMKKIKGGARTVRVS
jgi:DNA-binding IclR family transcriptional regulator